MRYSFVSVASALVVGMGLAWYVNYTPVTDPERFEPSVVPLTKSATNATDIGNTDGESTSSNISMEVSSTVVIEAVSEIEPESWTYVDGNVSIKAELDRQGVFIGYRVRTITADSRFADGELITEIFGQLVEHSAAGSELLIAGLMDPKTGRHQIDNP